MEGRRPKITVNRELDKQQSRHNKQRKCLDMEFLKGELQREGDRNAQLKETKRNLEKEKHVIIQSIKQSSGGV